MGFWNVLGIGFFNSLKILVSIIILIGNLNIKIYSVVIF